MINPFALSPPQALYIHVPFCQGKCLYCDFYSENYSPESAAIYSQRIQQELLLSLAYAKEKFASQACLEKPLQSIYFGGGTPSLLSAEQVKDILDLCRENFTWAKDIEISLEANPATELSAKLPAYLEAGVNRLSLGLQTSNEDLLQKIGRRHSLEDFLTAYQEARESGFKNISLDLIFGLPGQSRDDFREDLRLVKQLQPEHLSFYSLILEENTPLGAYYLEHPEELPSEQEERAMYHLIPEVLENAGYELYEISNAAKPGFASRHNSLYWRAEPYYACGPGASSYFAGKRRTRIANFHKWEKIVKQQWQNYQTTMSVSDLPSGLFSFEESVSASEARKEFMLLGFRLLDGVSTEKFKELFQEDMHDLYGSDLTKLCERGLIKKTSEGYCLSLLGRDLANQVFMAFV